MSTKATTHRALSNANAPMLSSYLVSNQTGLLVMGAYGHSRIRKFILGGAMLSKPPLPILFSH